MTNHPNRSPAYRVQHQNGNFSHVRGKVLALIAAKSEAGAPAETSERDLELHWGVRLIKVSPAQARAVGL